MKILVVCGNGLGTSLMLEMNVKKVLEEMKISAEVSHEDLSSASSSQADVWVGMNDIAQELKRMGKDNVIGVNNIMDKASLKEQLEALKIS